MFHILTRIYTTTIGVEPGPIRVIMDLIPNTTTLVASIGRTTIIGVEVTARQGTPLVVVETGRHLASTARVQRDLVLAEGIDSFEDINLAAGWPVWAVLPPGGSVENASR